MKVFISVDLEGITGVFNVPQTDCDGNFEWVAAVAQMQGDVNAVIEGCDDAGADEIVICDAHYKSNNLDIDALPAHASIVRGKPMELFMMQGIDDSFDAALFVGYHARQGTDNAVLCHSYTELATSVTVLSPDGGAPYVTGEIGMNGAVAGWFGVPVAFVSGDTATVAEARDLLPKVRTVSTKEGLGRHRARLFSPKATRPALRAGAAEALKAPDRPSPLDWNGHALRVSYADTRICDLAAACPATTRVDALTIEISAPDYLSVFRTFLAASLLAESDQQN
jgi:D-amino peptidase